MANSDHLALLRAGTEKWNQWRVDNQGIIPDLSSADLASAELEGANLCGVRLVFSVFTRANLRNSKLNGADLRWATFSDADLRDADLTDADARASFDHADMRRAVLVRTNLFGANLRSADLQGADFRDAQLRGANLTEANLIAVVNLEQNQVDEVGTRSGAKLPSQIEVTPAQNAPTPRPKVSVDAPATGAAAVDLLDQLVAEGRLGQSAGRAEDFVIDLFSVARVRSARAVPILSVYHQPQILAQRWYKLLAYVHSPSVLQRVHADSRDRLGEEAEDSAIAITKATAPIQSGAEITVSPQVPGCRFNPPFASFRWLEDWHCAEFRMRVSEAQPSSPLMGHVSFYIGRVLIGQVALVLMTADKPISDIPHTAATSAPYQAIFPSYSREDTEVVRDLARAYFVLGMDFLRDVLVLRSGEKWDDALLKKIEEADVFQLYWSEAARSSRYVEREWQHALSLHRPRFVRPLYWQEPMPEPPRQLADIHFSHLPWRGDHWSFACC